MERSPATTESSPAVTARFPLTRGLTGRRHVRPSSATLLSVSSCIRARVDQGASRTRRPQAGTGLLVPPDGRSVTTPCRTLGERSSSSSTPRAPSSRNRRHRRIDPGRSIPAGSSAARSSRSRSKNPGETARGRAGSGGRERGRRRETCWRPILARGRGGGRGSLDCGEPGRAGVSGGRPCASFERQPNRPSANFAVLADRSDQGGAHGTSPSPEDLILTDAVEMMVGDDQDSARSWLSRLHRARMRP